jgi:cbb3-type cytochrome oxidase cytochrome c subunit
MSRGRLLKEFYSAEDAKKVEETVKTGYAETAVENLLQWAAVEEDLEESYGQLAERAETAERKEAFRQLQAESKRNMLELSGLAEYLQGLDRARVKRIEVLGGLQPQSPSSAPRH